jgi:hypothetical protein
VSAFRFGGTNGSDPKTPSMRNFAASCFAAPPSSLKIVRTAAAAWPVNSPVFFRKRITARKPEARMPTLSIAPFAPSITALKKSSMVFLPSRPEMGLSQSPIESPICISIFWIRLPLGLSGSSTSAMFFRTPFSAAKPFDLSRPISSSKGRDSTVDMRPEKVWLPSSVSLPSFPPPMSRMVRRMPMIAARPVIWPCRSSSRACSSETPKSVAMLWRIFCSGMCSLAKRISSRSSRRPRAFSVRIDSTKSRPFCGSNWFRPPTSEVPCSRVIVSRAESPAMRKASPHSKISFVVKGVTAAKARHSLTASVTASLLPRTAPRATFVFSLKLAASSAYLPPAAA